MLTTYPLDSLCDPPAKVASYKCFVQICSQLAFLVCGLLLLLTILRSSQLISQCTCISSTDHKSFNFSYIQLDSSYVVEFMNQKVLSSVYLASQLHTRSYVCSLQLTAAVSTATVVMRQLAIVWFAHFNCIAIYEYDQQLASYNYVSTINPTVKISVLYCVAIIIERHQQGIQQP